MNPSCYQMTFGDQAKTIGCIKNTEGKNDGVYVNVAKKLFASSRDWVQISFT